MLCKDYWSSSTSLNINEQNFQKGKIKESKNRCYSLIRNIKKSEVEKKITFSAFAKIIKCILKLENQRLRINGLINWCTFQQLYFSAVFKVLKKKFQNIKLLLFCFSQLIFNLLQIGNFNLFPSNFRLYSSWLNLSLYL